MYIVMEARMMKILLWKSGINSKQNKSLNNMRKRIKQNILNGKFGK